MNDHWNGATFEQNGILRRESYRGVGEVASNVNMKHRIPLSEVIRYVEENAPGVPFENLPSGLDSLAGLWRRLLRLQHLPVRVRRSVHG